MELVINKQIDYDVLGYSVNDGWLNIYDWKKIKIVMRIMNIVIFTLCFLCAIIFKDQIKNAQGDMPKWLFLIYWLALIIVFIFIITPVHELLHLSVYTKNIFSKKCNLFIGIGSVSVHYDEIVSKRKTLISLLFPFIILSGLFILIGIYLKGKMQFWWFALLFVNALGCYSDIMMFFYILFKIPKGSRIYGNKYKLREKCK